MQRALYQSNPFLFRKAHHLPSLLITHTSGSSTFKSFSQISWAFKSTVSGITRILFNINIRFHQHSADSLNPSLVSRSRCHPTIWCGIPCFREDLDALWFHIPPNLLPKNWSCDWMQYQRLGFFEQTPGSTYDISHTEGMLHAIYGVSLPIRGVMYCIVAWIHPYHRAKMTRLNKKPAPLHNCLVLQDSLGDYYYYYEFSQGGWEFIAKFWAPHGTCAEDFVKTYFKGVLRSVPILGLRTIFRSNIRFRYLSLSLHLAYQ